MESRFLELPDGGRIAYSVAGSGPPLLLVSGLGGVASFWEGIAPALAVERTVILHDHRGTGRSSRCLRPYSIAAIASDVLALMDHLRVPTAALVGHSTGGAVAQHLALHAPERLERVVLSATWARACAYMRRLFALRREILEGLGLHAYRRLGTLMQTPPCWSAERPEPAQDEAASPHEVEIIKRRIGAVLAHDTHGALGRIRAPVLVVAAEDDIVVPAAHARQLAATIPDARLTMLPDGGHFVPQSRADTYRAVVQGFLHSETTR